MPKVKHIARFTSPVKLPVFSQATPTESTQKMTRHVLPDRLVELNKQRLENKKVLLDLIELALIESAQPLTVTELAAKLSQELNKNFDPNSLRVILKQLVDSNRVSWRVETSAERTVRAGGAKVRALHASLYWAPAGEVPVRTVTEVVPGVLLTDSSGRAPGTRNKSKKKKSSEQLTANNEVIDLLIERIVVERTVEIASRLEAAEAALERIRQTLKSYSRE